MIHSLYMTFPASALQILPDQSPLASGASIEETDVDYGQYTKDELKGILEERGIDYSSTAVKADLIKLLEDDDNG